MIQKLLEKLFYSNLFRNMRLQNYKNGYDQGRFDEDMERTYNLGKYEGSCSEDEIEERRRRDWAK